MANVKFLNDGPNFGATTNEPSLWDVIFLYYHDAGYPKKEAIALADRYIRELTKD